MTDHARWKYEPTIVAPDRLARDEKAQILRCIGTRWTALLLDLENGEQWLPADLSLTVIAAMAQPYAHPLLSAGNVLDLMVGLSGTLHVYQRYDQDGVLPDKDEDYLSGLDHLDRLAELWREVEISTFALLTAQEPCRWCTTRYEPQNWQVQRPHSPLCAECEAASTTASRLTVTSTHHSRNEGGVA